MEADESGTSYRLEFTIRLASANLNRLYHLFWSHPRIEQLLVEYYPHLFGLMSASVAVFAAARDRSRALARECPVAERLAAYFTKHVREERAHPGWLLQDMDVLGIDRERAFSCLPLPESAALIGAQYYWIQHVHPVAVLAYILLIEGNPPSTSVLDRVVARSAVPAQALRTFYRHAIIDLRHGAEVRELLDALPLREPHRRVLHTSAITSVDHLGRLVERLLRLVPGEASATSETE